MSKSNQSRSSQLKQIKKKKRREYRKPLALEEQNAARNEINRQIRAQRDGLPFIAEIWSTLK